MVASKKKAKRPAEPDPDDLFIERTDQLHELAKRTIEAGRRVKSAVGDDDLLYRYSTTRLVSETDFAVLVLDQVSSEMRIVLHHLLRAARRARR